MIDYEKLYLKAMNRIAELEAEHAETAMKVARTSERNLAQAERIAELEAAQQEIEDVAAFQNAVRDALCDEVERFGIVGADALIDGGGSDGDWKDFILTEIRQAFSAVYDAHAWRPASEPPENGRVVRCAIFRDCVWHNGFEDLLGFDFDADGWRDLSPRPEVKS